MRISEAIRAFRTDIHRNESLGQGPCSKDVVNKVQSRVCSHMKMCVNGIVLKTRLDSLDICSEAFIT